MAAWPCIGNLSDAKLGSWSISQGRGAFRGDNIRYDSVDDQAIKKLNEQDMKDFRLKHGATPKEFIKSSEDERIYFLKTSSRVGEAHLAEMVEAANN